MMQRITLGHVENRYALAVNKTVALLLKSVIYLLGLAIAGY